MISSITRAHSRSPTVRQHDRIIAYSTLVKMKVTIKKWNAVATWRWDLPEDDVCGICQVHFDGTCPTCKYPGDDCSLRMWPSSLLLEWP